MPGGKTRSTSATATDDMADLKEAISFISAKLDELLPIRKEISCVLKAVEKLERDSIEKDKKIKAIESRLDKIENNTQIGELLQKVATLEAEADKREQYSRRPNLRFHGIEETEGENTNAIVIAVVQQKLGLNHIGTDQLERSHRIGPKLDEKGSPRKRAVIVRFRSEAVRDEVYRGRVNLKNHNRTHPDSQVFLNEDLTATRANLAFKTRQLKRQKKIADCWTHAGRVLVKTLNGAITEIISEKNLVL